MEPKKITVENLEIAYYESKGTGPAVLLIHGNSSSGQTFQPQLESSLGERFRLVAIDLPGHGASARAAEPDKSYNLPGYARVVAGVVSSLGLDQAVVVGWSLGGHIALEAVKLLPEARGFLIYGTPPVGMPPAMDQAFLPSPTMGTIFQENLTPEEISAWGASCLKPGSTASQEFIDSVGQSDGKTRVGLAMSIGAGNYEDEVVIVKNLSRPLAILHGEYEQLVNLAYLKSLDIPTLWRNEVQVVADAGHTTHQEQPEKFNALLEAFVLETGK